MKRSEVQIRDPFVYVDKPNQRYVLVGSTDKNIWNTPGTGFEAYSSPDLEEFTYEGFLFKRNDEFWGTHDFWAPELHEYKGAFYLFASFNSYDEFAGGYPVKKTNRGTAILKSDSPLGEFTPWCERATPEDWMCLDGTFFVDDDAAPWIVFSHEWVEQGGGTICARRLSDDLSHGVGEAHVLFAAADAPWSMPRTHRTGITGYVTDGPFVARCGGKLHMLWSTMRCASYAIGVSSADTLLGEWRHAREPLFSNDGGHGMVFTDLAGQTRLAIHQPNDTPNERAIFPRVVIDGGGVRLL